MTYRDAIGSCNSALATIEVVNMPLTGSKATLEVVDESAGIGIKEKLERGLSMKVLTKNHLLGR